MGEFNSVFFHAWGNMVNSWWSLVGIAAFLIPYISYLLLRRKSDWSAKVKHADLIVPLSLAVIILMSSVYFVPYFIWKDDQTLINSIQQQVNGLQEQLSSITKLEIRTLPSENRVVNGQDVVNIPVTGTPDFRPALAFDKPITINNPDPNNHILEILWIKLPEPFKFTYLDPLKLPPNTAIIDGYAGTSNMVIVINDMSGGANAIIKLPIYTMDTSPSLRNLEIEPNIVILDYRILP